MTNAAIRKDTTRVNEQAHLENPAIADRLDSFAALLELAGANHYTARAYRRAAEMIRASKAPIADLIRAGRVRELRGIGPGIEARLRELVETGEIAEVEELERVVSPELVGLGRYLGFGPRRAMEIAEALGGEVAGDPRRWRDASERFAVVVTSTTPAATIARFARLPQIVSVVE